MKNNYIKTVAVLFTALFIFNQTGSAQTWSALGEGLESDNPEGVFSLSFFNDSLYAAGAFEYAGVNGANNVAVWNGTAWSPLGNGITADADFYGVNALANYKGNLYAGGQFDSAGSIGAQNIAEWNGANWSAVGQSQLGSGDSNFVAGLIVYDSTLFVGGIFSSGIPINVWNGTAWSNNTNFYGAATCFTIYQGNLYAGGFFYGDDEIPYGLAEWNDTTWNLLAPIGSVDSNAIDIVYALANYNGNLVAAGNFDSLGGVAATNIAQWNGSAWLQLGGGLLPADEDGAVYSLATFNGSLWAGGQITAAGATPVNGLAKWNGTSWTSPVVLSQSAQVSALLAESDNLYVGGYFDSIAGISANNIAEFTNPTGISPVTANGAASVYPNPGNGNFFVSLQNATDEYSISVYNITGERITQTVLNPDITELDLSTAAKGIYLYRITTAAGDCLTTGKIVVQ
jgi:hypothetical protein